MLQEKTAQAVKPRKVCILGYAEETRDLVFLLGEDVEIWGINMSHAFLYKPDGTTKTKARPTQWFQLHTQEWRGSGSNTTGSYGRPKEHVDFLAKFSKDGGTVWLQQPDERVPDAKMFPFEEIARAAGRDYPTSTFAYQLEMLWYEIKVKKEKVSDLFIYGVNLTAMDEYVHQKPCVEYWLGRLEELGVKLHIPPASSLLKGPKYARPADSGEDLQQHAKERLNHHREVFYVEWANTITGAAMGIETNHFSAFFNELAAKFAFFKENEELKQMVQERLSKRMNLHQTNMDRSKEAALNAHGMVTDNLHWLSMVGGFDQRANILPQLRYPNPNLAQDVDVPDRVAI